MPHQRDPDHPILADAWKYEVVEFHWSTTGDEPNADLVLRHAENGSIRRLRFRRPEEVRFAGVRDVLGSVHQRH